jgi:hypothetical protein
MSNAKLNTRAILCKIMDHIIVATKTQLKILVAKVNVAHNNYANQSVD